MSLYSNEVDLRILREMGVDVPDRRKYEKPLTSLQKFRAGVSVVIAIGRMQKLERQWRSIRDTGAELARVKKTHMANSTSRNAEKLRRKEL